MIPDKTQPETPRRLRDKLIEADLILSIGNADARALRRHLALIQDALQGTLHAAEGDALALLTEQDDHRTLLLRQQLIQAELERRLP